VHRVGDEAEAGAGVEQAEGGGGHRVYRQRQGVRHAPSKLVLLILLTLKFLGAHLTVMLPRTGPSRIMLVVQHVVLAGRTEHCRKSSHAIP
jgi:hypothetical protein